jgi:putative transposase
MQYDRKKHHRRSIRLPDHDYTSPGAYFVTIRTHQGKLLFGEVVDGEMRLTEWGQLVSDCWLQIPEHFAHVKLDTWVVMPNHLHGILVIINPVVGAQHAAPLPPAPLPPAPLPSRRTNIQSGSLGAIVRSFKSAVTRRINRMWGTPGTPVWQRNYYEHIIRNDAALERIREYIQHNPARWSEDRLHPAAPRNLFNQRQVRGQSVLNPTRSQDKETNR